jgi:hypothetical protein
MKVYVGLKCHYVKQTEKAILVTKDNKPVWLPKSCVLCEVELSELETGSRLLIDISMWCARREGFATSYDPVTKAGIEWNKQHGYTGYGLSWLNEVQTNSP